MKKLILFIGLVFFGLTGFSQYGNIRIVIKNISENKGNIKVALYNKKGEHGFLKDLESAVEKKIVNINKQSAKVSFINLPYGTYAVSLFHDKNNNGEIDRSEIGFPTEPYGVSGNKITIGPPKFKDCIFKLDSSEKTITIELKKFL